MSETFTAVKTAPTTKPKDTHVEVRHALKGGVLLYRPENNSFIALYPDEWLACRADGFANKAVIEALQDANREVTEKSLFLQHLLVQPNAPKAELLKARQALDGAMAGLSIKSDAAKTKVEAITDQRTDPDRLVELLPLTLKRIEGKTMAPIYVNAKRLQSAIADKRMYLVNGSAERKKNANEKLVNGLSVNTTEIGRRFAGQVQDAAKFEKEWKLAPDDAEHYGGILTDWAKVMGTTASAFLERGQQQILDGVVSADMHDSANAERMIDLKAEAQFMRWAAGAGASTTFMFAQGSLYDKRDKNWGQRFSRAAKSAQFSIKANAEASFAIGEAKVETSLYLPHAAGFHLNAVAAGQSFDFGYFRFRGDLTLTSLAGASVAIEADVTLMLTAGKQGIKGTPRQGHVAKGNAGGKVEAKVFAGVEAGVDLAGALQWLNPEGVVDAKAPKKAVASEQLASYTDIAMVGTGLSGMAGLAAKAGFHCEYRNGSFIVAAKAGACLGLGGSGSVTAKVGVEQISNFVYCVLHQLKQADYKKIEDVITENAFTTLNEMLYLAVIANRTLESFVDLNSRKIREDYFKMIQHIQTSGESILRQIERKLRSGWGLHAYIPPEARGAVICSIADMVRHTTGSEYEELRELAAYAIEEMLATTQSISHFDNTLDRITLTLGGDPGRGEGEKIIRSITEGTRFSSCTDRCSQRLAGSSNLIGRPFLRNDEPDFRLATFSLHHPGHSMV